MASVAEQLKTARQAQNLSVHRVAEITRMRSDHVEALERGDYAGFVAPVYIRGFVRAYARCVRLDEATVLADLDGELTKDQTLDASVCLEDDGSTPSRPGLLGKFRWRWHVIGPIVAGVALALVAFQLLGPRTAGRQGDSAGGIRPGLYPATNVDVVLPLPPPAEEPEAID